MKKIIQLMAIISFLMTICMFLGCETPQGGSSVPWNQPEPWEGQVMKGFQPHY